MEGKADAGSDARGEAGGFAGEFPAAREGCPRRPGPARSLERGHNPSTRRPAGFEEGRDVRPFLWRGDDRGGERRNLAGGRTKVHRPRSEERRVGKESRSRLSP